MPALLSATVTLNTGIRHIVKANDVLILARDCVDCSDIVLMKSDPKKYSKGQAIIIKDYYYTTDKTFVCLRGKIGKTLAYIKPIELTLISLQLWD